MAQVTEISWGDGSGDKLYFTRDSSEGNQTVEVSSDENTGDERSKTVTFSASGVTPQSLGIIQLRGGGGGGTVDSMIVEQSAGNSATFTGLDGEPIAFAVQIYGGSGTYINGSTTRTITSVISNGTDVYSTALYKSGSTSREYYYDTCTFSYSSGTLTVTSPGASTAGQFRAGNYRLIYVY